MQADHRSIDPHFGSLHLAIKTLHRLHRGIMFALRQPEDFFVAPWPFTNLALDTMTKVTEAAIIAARAEYQRRVEQVRAQDEGATPESDDDIDCYNVVVARGVTQEDVNAIPRQWLQATGVDLRADGTLVIVANEGQIHAMAVGRLATRVGSYCEDNGLDLCVGGQLFGADGQADRKQPDLTVSGYRTVQGHSTLVALVVFEFEVLHRTLRGLINIAAQYLRELPFVE